jgi:hypothetical protein
MNYWLSGFIDADGCFKIRYTEKKLRNCKTITKERIAVSFVLDQKKRDPKTNSSFYPL